MKASCSTVLLKHFSPSSLLLPSPELSDTKVYEPWMRALLETASQFCGVVVLKSIEHSGAQDKILTELRETVRKLRVQACNPHTNTPHPHPAGVGAGGSPPLYTGIFRS